MTYHIGNNQQLFTCPDCSGPKDRNTFECDTCRRKERHARHVIGTVAALGSLYGRKPCEHDWQTTQNWLIDRCAKCGEERA